MKERLTGAIVLVALIVLLVPELLTGPVRPGKPSAASGNSAEEPPLRSYTISLSDETHAQASGSGPAMPQPGSQDPAAQTASAASALPSPATSTPSPASDTSQPPASQPAAPTPAQKATPKTSKAAHPSSASAPSHTSPASPPSHSSAPGTGWVVQLGVFASHDNAEHLAREMRSKGFKASVSDVTSSSRHLYRVRIGPAPDRAGAQDLQGRLRAAGHSGTLVPLS